MVQIERSWRGFQRAKEGFAAFSWVRPGRNSNRSMTPWARGRRPGAQAFREHSRGQLGAGHQRAAVGGEEFAVVLLMRYHRGKSFAERLQHGLWIAPLVEGDRRIALTVSIALRHERGPMQAPTHRFLERHALYRAKERGRNQHRVS